MTNENMKIGQHVYSVDRLIEVSASATPITKPSGYVDAEWMFPHTQNLYVGVDGVTCRIAFQNAVGNEKHALLSKMTLKKARAVYEDDESFAEERPRYRPRTTFRSPERARTEGGSRTYTGPRRRQSR